MDTSTAQLLTVISGIFVALVAVISVIAGLDGFSQMQWGLLTVAMVLSRMVKYYSDEAAYGYW